MTNYYSFLPASLLIKTIFCLWIFCCLCLSYDQFYFWFSMKSCCLVYVQETRCVLFSVWITVFRSVIIGVFWFLNLSFPFWKDLIYFLRLLSAVCFRDLLQIRIMNYLRAIDNLVSLSFWDYQVYDHLNYFGFYNVTKQFR